MLSVRQICLSALSLGIVCAVPEVRADGPTPPPVMMNVAWRQHNWTMNLTDPTNQGIQAMIFDAAKGTWDLQGEWIAPNGSWSCTWDLEVGSADPLRGGANPILAGGFNFTNNMVSAQNFSASLALPAMVPAGESMRGNISGSLVDATGGAVLSTVDDNTPIYTALIDGSPVRTLLNAPYSTSVPDGGNDDWGAPAPASFGFEPAPSAVAMSIGIDHQFRLTGGGDTAVFVSRFEVTPEPASLALLALGGLTLVRRRS